MPFIALTREAKDSLVTLHAEALAALKEAHERLLAAIDKTEQSRAALHDAGMQCWIDKLDNEDGH